MKQEQLKWMILNKRLKLNFELTLSHYAIVLFLLLMPVLTLYNLFEIYVTKTYDGVRSATELLTVGLPWIIPAFIFYYFQHRKLKFKEVPISYTDSEFKEAVSRTINQLKWNVDVNNRNIFRAYRPFNYTLSWGEMITIIRQNDKLLVNSICDPNKISSVYSFGWNKKNIQTFLKNLQHVKEQLPITQLKIEKPINEWSLKRTFVRLLIYPFCLLLIAFGVYMILHPLAFRTRIAGVGAIAAGTFYLYLDLKIITSKKHKR